MTCLIWTISMCVICSQIYQPDFWLWHGWLGLSAGAWFTVKFTNPISNWDMVDLNSQRVRDLLSDLLTQFLTTAWLIWTLSECVICSQTYWPDFWPWHGRFGLSGSVWLALQSINPISDCGMVDLDSQKVCDLLSNLLTQFLTMAWLVWTLRMCVICSLIYRPDFWPWHGGFGLSGCVWFLSNVLTRFLTVTRLTWTLSGCVICFLIYWPISDRDMVVLDSQLVRDLLSILLTRFLTTTWLVWTLRKYVICSLIYWPDFWPWHGWFALSASGWFALKFTTPISDRDMADLDSQRVCDLLSNLLTQFLTEAWLIWTLSLYVICSQPYWPDFWPSHGRLGLSASAWFTIKFTNPISDGGMVDLNSQRVRDLLWNLLTRFLTMTWLIRTLRKCVVALEPIVIVSDLIVADFLSQDSKLDVRGFFPLNLLLRFSPCSLWFRLLGSALFSLWSSSVWLNTTYITCPPGNGCWLYRVQQRAWLHVESSFRYSQSDRLSDSTILCMAHPRVMSHDSSSSNPPSGTVLIILLCSNLDYRVA